MIVQNQGDHVEIFWNATFSRKMCEQWFPWLYTLSTIKTQNKLFQKYQIQRHCHDKYQTGHPEKTFREMHESSRTLDQKNMKRIKIRGDIFETDLIYNNPSLMVQTLLVR